MQTSPKIKPILCPTIHIKSLYTYKDFLRKRPQPQHTSNFKFSWQTSPSTEIPSSHTNALIKLRRSLTLLKHIQAIDLRDVQVRTPPKCYPILESIFKKLSKTPTIQLTRPEDETQFEIYFTKKWVRYLSKLGNISYKLASLRFPLQFQEGKDIQGLFKYLKYCPKIISLAMTALGNGSQISETFLKLKECPCSLKHLAIDSLLDREENPDFITIPFEHFARLESLKLALNLNFSYNFLAHNITQLSRLSNLRELSINFMGEIIPGLGLGLNTLAQRKTLKKLSLIFHDNLFIGEKTLKDLQGFSQLTHLALRVYISDLKSLKLISECFQNMKELEYLKLIIIKQHSFKSTDNLQILCEEINLLENLRHLKLSFELLGFSMQKETITSFIPHLQKTFTKQAKLETLSFTCAQIDSAQALLDLSSVLKDSRASLKKLKMNFENGFLDKQAQHSIINFIRNLENIRILKLPGIGIDSQNFLDQVVQGIALLKYLRAFEIGKISKEITKSGYLEAIEAILTKRGLRRFRCETSQLIFESSVKGKGLVERSSQKADIMDFEKIVRRNPSLENLELAKYPFDLHFSHQFCNWEEGV